jgi:hypothetical protein
MIEKERLIYGPYPKGDGTEVFGDPIAIYRRLVIGTVGEHNELLKRTRSEDEQERLEAEENLLPVAREALGMLPFDQETGNGATDREVLVVLRHYVGWMNELKKKDAI